LSGTGWGSNWGSDGSWSSWNLLLKILSEILSSDRKLNCLGGTWGSIHIGSNHNIGFVALRSIGETLVGGFSNRVSRISVSDGGGSSCELTTSSKDTPWSNGLFGDWSKAISYWVSPSSLGGVFSWGVRGSGGTDGEVLDGVWNVNWLGWLKRSGNSLWLVWIYSWSEEPVKETWSWGGVLSISLPSFVLFIVLLNLSIIRGIDGRDVSNPVLEGVTWNAKVGSTGLGWGLE